MTCSSTRAVEPANAGDGTRVGHETSGYFPCSWTELYCTVLYSLAAAEQGPCSVLYCLHRAEPEPRLTIQTQLYMRFMMRFCYRSHSFRLPSLLSLPLFMW